MTRPLIVACLFLVAAGCSSQREGQPVPNATTTVLPTTTEPAAASSTTAVVTTVASAVVTSGVAAAVEEETVPNVVGLDLQLAQDTLQAAGFYALKSHDATGQFRLQVYDRNWTVVDQAPAAGSVVPLDVYVDLGVVKDEEYSG